MNSVISIIVPVYNVEKYLRECMDNILTQTYIYFELLLVNNDSSDGSGQICDEYAQKDSRVQVFHKENEGK
jgi:glycosyltransferase involved in cell wall biosynthesis